MRTGIITALFLLLFSANSLAETVRYITDKTEITMRRGTGTQYAILRTLPSGMRVTIIHSDDSGYTQIRTPAGHTGWVLTRYLMSNPPASLRLEAIKRRYKQLQAETLQLQQRLRDTGSSKASTESALTRLRAENHKLKQKLAEIQRISRNSIQIAEENRALKERVVTTDRELQRLRQENESLNDRSDRDWFLVGAMVVIFSIIFGIMLTRIRWRKKTGWGEL